MEEAAESSSECEKKKIQLSTRTTWSGSRVVKFKKINLPKWTKSPKRLGFACNYILAKALRTLKMRPNWTCCKRLLPDQDDEDGEYNPCHDTLKYVFTKLTT